MPSFDVKRAYYLSGVPADAVRGGHAHRALHQILVAPAGGFEVHLDDGRDRRVVRLDSPETGLHVRPLIWRELSGFRAGSVCLVLASEPYDEADYIRDYAEFVELTQGPADSGRARLPRPRSRA